MITHKIGIDLETAAKHNEILVLTRFILGVKELYGYLISPDSLIQFIQSCPTIKNG